MTKRPDASLSVDSARTETFTELPAAAAAAAPVTDRLDDESRYAVASELARGGLGRILLAHDQRLDRPVAIKESLARSGIPDARFRREAAITARLQHPSIVPIHDAGSWKNGAPYYVMKLLSGGSTLKQLVADTRGLDARLALLPNIIAVADAVAYAHSRGIIHRDLKPSNVLVGPFGETLLIDWGLAKDLSQPGGDEELYGDPYRAGGAELTSTGTIIGTPQYMAPEQAHGQAVDKRADVYALGALLYYLLSGAAPYAGGSSVEILERVRTVEPIALDLQVKGLPRDLYAIVNKAMARRVEDRYADAQELVDDLKRFQTGQLVQAQEYSSATLAWRWISRHRAPLMVALVFFVASSVMAGLGVRRLARARDLANRERAEALAKRNELILLQARSSLKDDPSKSIAWLKSYPLDGSDWMTVQELASQAYGLGVARHLMAAGQLLDLDFLPDGVRMVTVAQRRSQIDLWDAEQGVHLKTVKLKSAPNLVQHMRDGSSVAVSSITGEVVIWNVDSGRVRELGRHAPTIYDIRWSPGDQYLASAGRSSIKVWNAQTGEAREFGGHPKGVNRLAWGGDGVHLFSIGPYEPLIKTNVLDGTTETLDGHVGRVQDITASSDGTLIATSGDDGKVQIWPVAGGKPLVVQASAKQVKMVRFIHDSHRFVTTGADRTVAYWDEQGHLLRRSPEEPDPQPTLLEVTPDNGGVVVTGTRGSVQEWNLQTGTMETLRGHATTVQVLSFGRNGTLVTGGLDRFLRVWLRPMRPAQSRAAHLGERISVATFTPDGRRLFSIAGRDLFVCDVAAASCRIFARMPSWTHDVAVAPDGSFVAESDHDGGSLHTWDLDGGHARVLPTAGSRLFGPIITPDSQHIIVASTDGNIYIWPRDGGAPRLLHAHAQPIEALALAADGRTLVSGAKDGSVVLSDWPSGSLRTLGKLGGFINTATFSHDGSKVVVGAQTGELRLWQLPDGATRQLYDMGDVVGRVEFSPDDRELLASGWNGSVVAWHVAANQFELLREHEGRVRALSWSPDGRLFVTGADDRWARLWDRASGATIALAGHSDVLRCAVFSPDGKVLVTSSEDQDVRFWDVASVPLVVPRAPASLAAWLQATTDATAP